MLDIKIHVLHGKQFHVIRGPLLIPCVLGVTALTAASFYLNGVFAFAISKPGRPRSGPPSPRPTSTCGPSSPGDAASGSPSSFSALIATRWGAWPFVISQSIVVGIMMLCYLAVPARIVGIERKNRSRRDSLAATCVGGAVGAVVCSPPYLLGRLGILMLGWHYLFWPGVLLIVIGAALQTGMTSAVKAVKFSAKLVGSPATASIAAEPASRSPDNTEQGDHHRADVDLGVVRDRDVPRPRRRPRPLLRRLPRPPARPRPRRASRRPRSARPTSSSSATPTSTTSTAPTPSRGRPEPPWSPRPSRPAACGPAASPRSSCSS